MLSLRQILPVLILLIVDGSMVTKADPVDDGLDYSECTLSILRFNSALTPEPDLRIDTDGKPDYTELNLHLVFGTPNALTREPRVKSKASGNSDKNTGD